MKIVQRNDKHGNPIADSTKITKVNCPDLQEILNDIYTRIECFSTQQKTA